MSSMYSCKDVLALSTNIFLITDFPDPWGVISILPFVSVDDIILPSNFKLSTLHSSIFLLESNKTLDEAVATPCEWSKRFVKYSPAISIGEFEFEVGSPMNKRKPLPPAPAFAAEVS